MSTKTAYNFMNKLILTNIFRPREVSSKIPVQHIKKVIPATKKQDAPRDPRFDSSCGEFDEKVLFFFLVRC